MNPELRICIIKLTPRSLGNEVEVCVKIDAVSNDTVVNSEVKQITVASEMLFAIGNIGMGSLPYELSRDGYDTLEYDGELWEVVKKGLDLLSYGDNTQRQLETKLRSRGFSRELSAEAAEYLVRRGNIDEESILERYVENLAGMKKYGPARIRQELARKGFSRDIIDSRLGDIFDSINFDENLGKLVEKKFDFSRYGDRKYRESFIGSMYRLGYGPSDTMKKLKEKNEE